VRAPVSPPAVEPPTPAPPSPPPVKKASPAPKKAAAKKAAKKVAKATKKASSSPKAWVVPQGQVCPLSHPIKVKIASRIYHLPGMLAYTRTNPDRCYATETAAKRDGFSPAKR
jgi:micrococcal nuclease